jgi:hypothetical protein
MPFKPLLIFIVLLSLSCNNNANYLPEKNNLTNIRPAGTDNENPYPTIADIPLPDGFTRVNADSNSFDIWLRKILLKKDKTVYLYDGQRKLNQTAQFAVLDISTGNKNLQQCADAVMRLRAEYLFAQKRFSEIIFIDNENIQYKFSLPYTHDHFASYLQQVFGMCGSASLAKQLKPVDDFNNIEPGDILIRGGFPGHAVIVMDVATDTTGKKIFMLAQSYMPAQDIHVLVNPINVHLSPWYTADGLDKIITPEYVFYKTELKKW